MKQDKSYIGSGNILIREYGAAAPYEEIGNCSKLTLSPAEEVKQLRSYIRPGGGLRNEVRRVTGVGFAYTFHDFDAENFARGLRSEATSIAGGTATDEELVAYKGGYTPTAKIITAITNVESPDGLTTYDEGDDYELRDGQLYIPADSGIPDPVAGAANCQITYTYVAQKKVEALVNSNKQYSVIFMGLNEAQSGKRVRIRCHKVSGGVLKEMALIGEDFGAGDVEGGLLEDTSIAAIDESKYYVVEMED